MVKKKEKKHRVSSCSSLFISRLAQARRGQVTPSLFFFFLVCFSVDK